MLERVASISRGQAGASDPQVLNVAPSSNSYIAGTAFASYYLLI
jgi:hypothetical protein